MSGGRRRSPALRRVNGSAAHGLFHQVIELSGRNRDGYHLTIYGKDLVDIGQGDGAAGQAVSQMSPAGDGHVGLPRLSEGTRCQSPPGPSP